MVKNKLGEVQKQLQKAVVAAGTMPAPVEEPAKRRRRSKSKPEDDPEMPPKSSVTSEIVNHGGGDKPASRYPSANTPVVDGEVPVPSWDNFELIKSRYRLTDEETTKVLLECVGPDPRGSGFWQEYQKRVKEELSRQLVKTETTNVEEKEPVVEVPTPAGIRRRLRPLLPDNQLGDPEINRQYNDMDDDTFVDSDGEGEEEATDDDDDIIMEVQGGQGGDDQDSPQSGSIAVKAPEPTLMVTPQPDPPAEPVKGDVVMDENGKRARDDLKKKLGSRPTAARNSRGVPPPKEPSAPSPENLKPLLSCETLQLGQQKVHQQASNVAQQLDRSGSEVDTEVGPSASEVHGGADDDQVAALVKSLPHIQHTLQDPKLRAVISNVAPQLLSAFATSGDAELDNARDGKPSSSRPTTPATTGPVDVKPAFTPIPNKDDLAPPADPAAPNEEMINSSTHRAAHARLARRMSAADVAKFPQMVKLWSGSRKDKQELLKQFVQHGKNIESIETTLTLSREQVGSVQRNRELLTIGEMKAKGFSQAKIDSIIARNTPHPDPDAPEDPASVRFWANCGGVASEVESTKLQASAQATVQSTGDILSSIVGSDPMAPDTGRVANGPTLRALVDVASTPVEAPTAKSKAKAKAKAKSRVSQQTPKTPAEQRNAIRSQLRKELTQCIAVGTDLPQGDPIRAQLLEKKEAIETALDELKDTADGDLDGYAQECADLVKGARILRAQGRAIAAELRKDEKDD